jgi:hypothetical protein
MITTTRRQNRTPGTHPIRTQPLPATTLNFLALAVRHDRRLRAIRHG